MWRKRNASSSAKLERSGRITSLRTSAVRLRSTTRHERLGRELAHRLAVEHGALHGDAREQRPLLLGQPLEPRGEQRVDRGRHGQLGQLVHQRPAPRPRGEAARRRSASRAAPRRTAGCPRRPRRCARPPRSAGSRGSSRFVHQLAGSRPGRAARAGSRSAFSLPPPQPGRASSSSGRAMQSSTIGASRARSATCSTRSRKVGSAHWRSSSTTTSGRGAGQRLEQPAHRPEDLLARRRRRSRRGRSPRPAPSAISSAFGSSPSRAAMASRESSAPARPPRRPGRARSRRAASR